MTFYNYLGEAICYLEDGVNIYLFTGKPVGYIYNDSIYSFQGRHLGWLEDGWIIDNQGYYVYFSENASGGPIKPIKQIKPIKGIKQIKPIKGIKEIKPIKPIKHLSWSQRDIF